MLQIRSIKENKAPPKVIDPLLVFENSVGKMGLILDLRYINEHIYKDKIKFDNWQCFKNYLEQTDGYVFKFDLKSRYYHLAVFEEHQTYLDFSWKTIKMVKFFAFIVPPFSLSLTSFVFTKVVRSLVQNWTFKSMKIVCFRMIA